jgi:pimeloyl-ACP methyl ester carboxylesterase
MPAIVRRPSVRRLALRDIMRHGELVSPAEALGLAQSSLRCTIAAQAIEALNADREDLALRELDRISCPVRLASPQFDRILPAERHAPRYRREIPGVDSMMLPGCGHVPMWDDAELVIRTITEFVDRHTAAPAAGPVGLASA